MKNTVFKLLLTLFMFVAIWELYSFSIFAEDKKVILNNNKVIGVTQIKIDNVVYVSAIPALNLFGWNVEWKPSEKHLYCTKDNGNNLFIVKVNSSEVILNGDSIILDKPAIIIDGDIYIPSKFVAEKFGVQIRWSNKDNLIILSGYDEKNVYVEGEGNIVMLGNGIIVNIFEALSNDTIYDIATYADRLLQKNKPQEAIKWYREVLANINADENKELYTHTLINLGNAYSLVAEIEDAKKNTSYAIEQYEKVLQFSNKGYVIDSYGSLLNNLGKSYMVLFEINGDKNNLDKSLEILNKGFDNKKNYSTMENALICHNLGLAYQNLHMKDLENERFYEAISLYEKSLKLHTIEQSPQQYALIQYKLGNVYMSMRKNQCRDISLEASKSAYKEALKIWSVESFPENYARVHKCLGDLYRNEYYLNGCTESLEGALSEYHESLMIFSPDKYVVDYAKVHTEMAGIYFELSKFKDNNNNLKKAIVFYKRAFAVLRPLEYSVACNKIALELTKAYGLFMMKRGMFLCISLCNSI